MQGQLSRNGVLYSDQEEVQQRPEDKKFENLAMILITSVKSLMVYCDQQESGEKEIQLRDKDIEQRVKIINDILEMGSDISEK